MDDRDSWARTDFPQKCRPEGLDHPIEHSNFAKLQTLVNGAMTIVGGAKRCPWMEWFQQFLPEAREFHFLAVEPFGLLRAHIADEGTKTEINDQAMPVAGMMKAQRAEQRRENAIAGAQGCILVDRLATTEWKAR